MHKEIRTVVGHLGHSLCVRTNDGPGGRVDKKCAIRACAWPVGCVERACWERSGGGEDGEDKGRCVEDVVQHC